VLAVRKALISTLAAFFAGAALLAFWAKREHRPAQAIAATHAYIEGVDTDPGWKARLRSCVKPTSFTPFQTNGNRLRRLAGNVDRDPPEVTVDFSIARFASTYASRARGPGRSTKSRATPARNKHPCPVIPPAFGS
jgi:hypothetical protein